MAVAWAMAACASPEPEVRPHSPERWALLRDLEPRSMTAVRVAEPPVIDGLLDEWSEEAEVRLTDVRRGTESGPDTRVRVRWDDTHLYIAAWLAEEHVWAQEADSTKPVWRDNDFEVFIEPDGDHHNYLEIEVNALNTRNQIQFPRPMGDAGRSDRRAWFGGFRSAIGVQGSLNDASDRDTSWTVELAFPWQGFERYGTDGGPPDDGAVWRMNFARIQWPVRLEGGAYARTAGRLEEVWAWSPHGVVLMHIPEMFGRVQFRAESASADLPDGFESAARTCLLDVYYAWRISGELDLDPARACGEVIVQGDSSGFLLTLTDPETGRTASIDHRRRLGIPAFEAATADSVAAPGS